MFAALDCWRKDVSTFAAGNAEEREVRNFVKAIANWVWPPIVSILAFSFLFRLGNEFQWFSNKLPDPLPDLFKQILKPGGWVLFLFSVLLVVFVRRARVPVVTFRMISVDGHKIDLFRLSLAVFFFLYAYIVAKGLIPLPDQAPRIDFRGVLCVTAGMVIAWFCLVSNYRLFLTGTWLFILWVAIPQMEKRLNFLEMMLEPTSIEKVTFYGLALVMVVLMLPRAMQTFSAHSEEYKVDQPMLFKKGLPF